MNAIWQARKGRSIGRRIIDYLALVMLFPVVVNLGLGTSAALHSPVLLDRMHAVIPAWVATLLLRPLPFLLIAGVFALLYQFLPNTKVKFSAAMTGGVGAALGLLVLEKVYLTLQIGVARYNAIYGSFATVPLFLLWIHLGWLVFLAGAELAFAVQVQHHYRPDSEKETPIAQLAAAFDILTAVRDDFQRCEPTRVADLGGRIGTGDQLIHAITAKLLAAGLLRRVENGGDTLVTPAGPPENMRVDTIITAIWGAQEKATPGARLTASLLRTAIATSGHVSIQEIGKQGIDDQEAGEQDNKKHNR
jgi:membrane protein